MQMEYLWFYILVGVNLSMIPLYFGLALQDYRKFQAFHREQLRKAWVEKLGMDA